MELKKRSLEEINTLLNKRREAFGEAARARAKVAMGMPLTIKESALLYEYILKIEEKAGLDLL